LLRVASRDQACIEIFNILFTQAKESLSVNFIAHFTVIQTKTYIFDVSTLPKSIRDKTMAKKR